MQVKALAACGVGQREIADFFGVSRKTFGRRLEEEGDLARAYRSGLLETKEKILKKCIAKALDGDTIMLIYLSKALCGLTDKPVSQDEVRDKAAAIRDMLDKMNSGLEQVAKEK